MIKKIASLTIGLFVLILCNGQELVNIELDPAQINQMNISENNGIYQIETLGGDPFVRSKKINQTYNPDTTYIIEFEYLSLTGLDDLRIYFSPFNGANSASSGALPIAEGWTNYIVNLKRLSDTWVEMQRDFLRFDFGKSAGKTISVRNIKLRTITAKEYNDWINSPDKVLNQKLVAYNNSVFSKKIENVKVSRDTVIIKGSGNESLQNCYLSEIRMHENAFDKSNFEVSFALPATDSFTLKVPRFATNSNNEIYDRLYSRWIINDASGQRLSHAHWANDIYEVAKWDIPEIKPISPKGMGGISNNTEEYWDDLVDLGVHNITYNFLLPSLFTETPGTLVHKLYGKTYYINQNVVNRMDKFFQFCSDNDIQVSIILLIGYNGKGEIKELFKHPDATGGTYTLANVVDERGIEYYVAAIDYLAQRYSQPDNEFGRITNWIIHNEVDAAPVWTNAGGKPQELYIEQYSRSMRTVYYTARKYNPTSKVFISLTHHWFKKHTYTSPELLQSLTDMGQREGDFEWGLAYHPYPENLREPDAWKDVADLDIETANYILPKNLELIDLWARTSKNLYNGRKVRSILLSENGISHHNYSREQIDLQAAGVAYYWKKLRPLPTIEAFHYHRWVDHETEGNLKFGLWRNKEGTVNYFGKKKPSWTLYKYAGSNFEDTAFDFTKDIMGIANWSDIYNVLSPEINPYTIHFEVLDNSSPVPGLKVHFNGEVRTTTEAGKCSFYNVASSIEEKDVLVETEQNQFVHVKTFADEDKLITIDIGKDSKEENGFEKGIYMRQLVSYEPFDYAFWNSTGVSNILLHESLKIYPNPVRSTLHIDGVKSGSLIELYSVTGKLIFQKIAEEDKVEIDVSNVVDGIYVVYLRSDSVVGSEKVVVKKY